MPNITNQIAIIEENDEENEDSNIVVLEESESYFNQLTIMESRDLKFFFSKDKDDQPEMLCYFLQACPHQQNLQVMWSY